MNVKLMEKTSCRVLLRVNKLEGEESLFEDIDQKEKKVRGKFWAKKSEDNSRIFRI